MIPFVLASASATDTEIVEVPFPAKVFMLIRESTYCLTAFADGYFISES